MTRGADRSLSFVFLRRNSFLPNCSFHRKGMLGLDQWGIFCWLLLGYLHYCNRLASLLTEYMRQSRKQKTGWWPQ
jgi:hypothetical protein